MNELLRRLLFLPEQASTYARDVDWLHYAVITTTMAGAALVFAVALAFLVRYRRRSVTTERVTSALPFKLGSTGFIVVLFVSFWVVGFQQYLHMENPPEDAMEVYVTAKQWMWKFSYPGGPASVGVLYVPVNRPVKLFLTSRDVIHSFYVPAFRMKKDVVPGRYTLAWFEANQTGRFPVRCAEFCGASHSEMLAEVVVMAPEAFESWLGHPTAPPGEALEEAVGRSSAERGLVAAGREAVTRNGCLQCHTLDGRPHLGPTFLGLYGRVEEFADGGRLKVDEAYLTESMMDPLAHVVAGFEPIMPSYFGRLVPADAAAIIELIRSLQPQTPIPSPPRRPVPGAGAPP